MQVIHQISELKKTIKETKEKGHSIGFVPTMGFLHEGHLFLMRTARKENDLLVISIFVNPLQFGEGEDLEEYPRDLTKDRELAYEVGCDLVFAPPVQEMYPPRYATFVDVERLTGNLCGATRPGHFRGVTTVVTKLFNLVQPDRAYFGQKDAQQALVLKKMVNDLNMNLELIVLPTVREEDGLAMSSRNSYLSPQNRREAAILYRSLQQAQEMVAGGERDASVIKETITMTIKNNTSALIDYIEITDTRNIKPLAILEGECLIALAVKFGETRLIDNLLVEV